MVFQHSQSECPKIVAFGQSYPELDSFPRNIVELDFRRQPVRSTLSKLKLCLYPELTEFGVATGALNEEKTDGRALVIMFVY